MNQLIVGPRSHSSQV